MEAQQQLKVSIRRGTAEGGFESYSVPFDSEQTILDLLTHIQRNVDSSLSYRFACRVGMCGSCAMRVNGRPRWACRTLVKDVARNMEVQLEPLKNLKVVKDLVVDMEVFFDKWQKAKGRFEPKDPAALDFASITPDSPKRQAVDAAIECINCGCCYSACDVVEDNPAYLGPAALNRAWSLMNDERDVAGMERIEAVTSDNGCQNCHTNQQCAARCPLHLNPTRSIAGLKRLATMAFIRGGL